ncbi:MAG: hypothetical protein K2X11_22395 [Acetobacteraceae bacterium]|nr:hypothetical protein [Acetobacteraceae bacterium]
MTPDPRLPELVAARLTHDLGSPISTVVALQSQAADPSAASILRDTVEELSLRLRLLSAAFGPPDEMEADAVRELLRGASMAHRVRFVLEGPAPGPLPPAAGRLLLVAGLLAGEALPRGGTVHLAADPGATWAVWPEGRDAAWSRTLLELLAGGTLDAALAQGPRHLLAPWLFCVAEAAGRRPALAHAPEATATPPLLLG